MKTPLNLFESLVVVAESQNLMEASSKLNVSQPALSVQLKKLAEGFKLPLFETHGKKKVLTPFGLSVYKEVKRILGDIDSSFEEINRNYLTAPNLIIRLGGRRE